MATTDTYPSEIVRRVAEEAWGGGDLDVVDESVAPGFVSHTTAVSEDVRGAEGHEALRSAMPDLAVEVEETIADCDRVAIRYTTPGTREGELMGIEPTGKEVEGRGAVIAHFEDGKVVEVWEFGDQLGMLEQLGVVEPPGA